MPRNLLRAEGHDRERSLGWLAIAWIEFFCRHGAHGLAGKPIELSNEQAGLLLDVYAHDPEGRRYYSHVFFSRPKSCYKSGLAAFFVLFDTLGPSRFDGFAQGGETYTDPWGLGFTYTYNAGEPMGRSIAAPNAMLLATEEGQTGHVYNSVFWNLSKGPLARIMPRNGAGLTRCNLPDGGEIVPSTSGAASKDGGNPTVIVADEVHLYYTPQLRGMFTTADGNLFKRGQDEPLFIITTTWFGEGQGSIAEDFFEEFKEITANQERDPEDRNPLISESLLFDHRYGSIAAEDLGDDDKLSAALVEAYGDAIEWNSLTELLRKARNRRTTVAWLYRYLLNAPSTEADQWLASWEWNGAGQESPAEGLPEVDPIRPGDVIVLGMDGSEGRVDEVLADSTAIVGCRVSDGALFTVGLWEQPLGLRLPGDGSKVWSPPRDEVEATLAKTFETYQVIGFWADPAGWTSELAAWAAKWGSRLTVKASQQDPISWWMTGRSSSRTAHAIGDFHTAIVNGNARHFDEPHLTAHALNARTVGGRSGVQLRKPEAPLMGRKIDLAVAAVIAWQARLAAIRTGAKPVEPKPKRAAYAPFRLY